MLLSAPVTGTGRTMGRGRARAHGGSAQCTPRHSRIRGSGGRAGIRTRTVECRLLLEDGGAAPGRSSFVSVYWLIGAAGTRYHDASPNEVHAIALAGFQRSRLTVPPRPYGTGMAKDWEATLRAWVKSPSDAEDAKRDKTQTEIKQALASSAHLKGVGYKLYAKGSYANNTNVRLDYDVDIAVDIAVECTDFYYHDETGAAADVKKVAVQSSSAVTPAVTARTLSRTTSRWRSSTTTVAPL